MEAPMRKALVFALMVLGLAAVAGASDHTYPYDQTYGPYTLQAAATTGNGQTLDTNFSAKLAIRINWGTATTGTIQCQQATVDAGPWSNYSAAMAVDTVTKATALNVNEAVGIFRCVFTSNADQAVTVTAVASPLR
jgi:hypothetical protein